MNVTSPARLDIYKYVVRFSFYIHAMFLFSFYLVYMTYFLLEHMSYVMGSKKKKVILLFVAIFMLHVNSDIDTNSPQVSEAARGSESNRRR